MNFGHMCPDQRLRCPTPHLCQQECYFDTADVRPINGIVAQKLLASEKLPTLMPLYNHEPAPAQQRHQPPHWTDTLAWIGFGLMTAACVGIVGWSIVRIFFNARFFLN